MTWTELKNKSLALLCTRFEDREANAMLRILHEDILLGKIGTLDDNEQLVWTQAIQRLLANEPIAYITGVVYFLNLKLNVGPGVLIPRPETEELASLAIQHIRKLPWSGVQIVDIGTGSGCLALALKYNCPESLITAVDWSDAALAIAPQNAKRLGLPIDFKKMDILNPEHWRQLPPSLDYIISNPPYIQTSERNKVSISTLNHEPEMALFAEDDPLKFYKAIAALAIDRLNPEGTIFVEINEFLGPESVQVFQAAGFTRIQLYPDLSGKDRVLIVHA